MQNKSEMYPAVVMLASARHDAPYASTAYALAKEMARDTVVFFVDNPFSWKDFFSANKQEQIKKRYTASGKIKNAIIKPDPALPGLHVVVSPLVLPANFLPHGQLYKWVRKRNLKAVGKQLKKLLLNEGVKDYIYLNSFNPFYWKLPDYIFPARHSLYQTVDRISQAPYLKKHGPRLEKEAMAEADLGITTSSYLADIYADMGNVHCLPNAADVALFKKALTEKLPVPEDWPAVSGKPVAIYTGHFEFRSDLTLISALCKQLPEITFVILGPRSGEAAKWAENASFSNLKFIEKKRLEELPAYLQQADLAIIPFKCNELTKAIYPLKINEYLAAGLPVVATPFSDDIKSFDNVIAIEHTVNGWVNAIQQALANDSEEERVKRSLVAEQNSWESRIKQFWQLYQEELIQKENLRQENATTV